MGHHHGHHHSTKNIKAAFFLNLSFTIVEFIGGFYTNSLAIMSDAVHDLGDSLSLGMSWYFQKLSNKKATKSFTYGFLLLCYQFRIFDIPFTWWAWILVFFAETTISVIKSLSIFNTLTGNWLR